ncbi:MAG: class I SAM-dependent methyltransferase [Thiovulaceae bacterium]|nr:class I SAM-dependent methyltransferase [Sulfurimonadaceae bacterium]
MHHIKEFSRFAKSYGTYNVIQREVAKELAQTVTTNPQCIIDLGCGSGTFYDALDGDVERYIAVDLSDKMLELHPKDKNIEFIHADFDDKKLFEKLKSSQCQYLVSSSSLQWSQDLKTLFQRIYSLEIPFALALFTANTFKQVHQTAKLSSPLLTSSEVSKLAEEIFGITCNTKTYTLKFDSKRELFSYIKKSGVSGTKRQLNYKETKRLMQEYPLDYLEFEVIFLIS